MDFEDAVYRLGAYGKHFFTARHTLGYGIHSPYLYYLVHFILYDENAYYCFAPIEKERQRLLRATREVFVEDLGTGRSGRRTVQSIANTSLKSPAQAQLLFRLVRFLHPATALELGTSLGITTAYLAFGAHPQKVTTLEGSPEIAAQAQQVWAHLGLTHIEQRVGNIDLLLPAWAQEKQAEGKKVDFAFLDANHTQEATLRYFECLLPLVGEKTVLVLDDIHASRAMGQAWRQIQQAKEVTTTMDFYHFGLVFFDPHLLRRNYVLKI